MSRAGARAPLESALFGNATAAAGEGAIGQFAPGAAGGPNSTAGFERGALINSWDYILMLEGALVFAASATRRLGAAADAGILSYPFTVRTTSAAGAAPPCWKKATREARSGCRFGTAPPLWPNSGPILRRSRDARQEASARRAGFRTGRRNARRQSRRRGVPTFRLLAALRQSLCCCADEPRPRPAQSKSGPANDLIAAHGSSRFVAMRVATMRLRGCDRLRCASTKRSSQ